MLASLGFTVTGLFFAIFAYTFERLVVEKTKLKLVQFSGAYYCLAIALLLWGISAAVGGNVLLQCSVIVGDSFLLLGTLFMLYVWLGQKQRLWIWHAAIIAESLIYLRARYYLPMPYMKNGILIFNTQTPVAIVLALVFICVWLPVNVKVAKMVSRAVRQDSIRSTYTGIYVTATIAAIVFISSRKRATVILSFIALGICFALLICSNVLVKMLEEQRGSHKRAK